MTARAAKAEATKARIRASAMRLYCERPIEDFTLEEVAERAATTVRTVLRAFASKDQLIHAALGEMAAGGVFLPHLRPGDVAATVRPIFDIYESVGDLVMRWLNDEDRHPALKPLLDQGRENHRNGIKAAFAPQLSERRGMERRQLLHLLIVATDVYVWKLLRRDLRLGRAAAEALVSRMITSIIEQEHRDGSDSLAELVGRRQPSA